MANVVGYARSNYFPVKDIAAFHEAMLRIGLTVIDGDSGTVGVLNDQDDCGCWPVSFYDEDRDEDIDVDVAFEISKHLQDGHVCVLQEISHMKLISISGWAEAINSDGERRSVSIDDIFRIASADLAGENVAVRA